MTAIPIAQEHLFYRSIRLIAVGWCAERRCDTKQRFLSKALGAKIDEETEKEVEYNETTEGSSNRISVYNLMTSKVGFGLV